MIKNNNPLNIRHSGSRWRGMSDTQKDRNFVQFNSVEWGLRAGFCILRTYATKHKCHCINDIITRWAPPCENNTQQYIRNVCLWTGFGGNQRLTESDWPRLIRAMAKMESGVWLSEEVIERAWRLFQQPATEF